MIVCFFIDLQPLTTTLALLGKLFSTAGFATIYIISAEVFPTVIRNAGMGSSSVWARVGGMISPYIADTVNVYVHLRMIFHNTLKILNERLNS